MCAFRLATSKVYLAACSHSPVYEGMIRAIEEYKRDLIEYGNPWDLWVEKVSEARSLFARLIGASKEEVAPGFSVSTSLDALLSSFSYEGRNELVTSDLEYPTTNYILLAQKRYGARTVTIKSRGYTLTPDDYRSYIGAKTRLVTAIQVSSLNGYRQELEEVIRLSHASGAEVYVDSYQAAGNLHIDVRKLDTDYLASGTLKYLLGLPGLAFLYVRHDLISQLEPAFTGWFSQKDPFLFGAEALEYADDALRFQSGTWSIPALYASIEGLKVVLERGTESIEGAVRRLTRLALELGHEKGLSTITPDDDKRRGAIVSFVVREPHSLEVKLNRLGIVTSSRGTGLRLAPHFYNTKEDIERAIEAISLYYTRN